MASPIFASSPGILVTAADYSAAAPAGPVVLLPITYTSTIGNQIVVRDGAGQASAVTPITVSTVGGVGYTRDISSTVISSILITSAGDYVAVAPVTPYLYKVLYSTEFPNTGLAAPLSIKPSYELISTVSTATLDALSSLQLQGSLDPLVAFQFTNPATSYAEFTSTVTNTVFTNTFYSGTSDGPYNYHSTSALSTMTINASDVIIGGAHDGQNMTVIGHMDVCGSVAVGGNYSTVEGGIVGTPVPFSAESHVSVADGFSTVSNFYSGDSIDVSGGFTIGGHVSTGQLAVAGLATHKSTVYVSSALTVGTVLAVDSAAYTSSIAAGKTEGPSVALDISGGFFGLGAFIDAGTYSTTLISTGAFTASTVNLDNGTPGVFRSLYTSNSPSRLYYDGVEIVGGAVDADSKVQEMTVSSFVSAAVLFVSSAFLGGADYASPFQLEVNGGIRVVEGQSNRLYVAGGSNNTTDGIGTLKWSADGGLTWNDNVTGGFSNSVAGGAGQGVGWNGKLWVAVGHTDTGQKSTIQTSIDGSNWTAAASGGFGPDAGSANADGHGVAWNGQQWVAAGSYGNDTTPLGSLLYSGDGSNWSNAVTGGFSGSGSNGATGYDVAWNGRQWVAVGRTDISRNYPIDSMSPSARDSLVGLYSLKKLRSAYTGPLISVRRSVDNLNNDFYGDLNGNLSNLSGTSITSWISGGSGFITKWWDQSTRSNHATQITDASQPSYNSAGYLTLATGQYFALPDGTVPGSNSKYTMVYKHGTINTATNRVILASGYNSNSQGIFLSLVLIPSPSILVPHYRDDWRANSTQFSNYAASNTFTAVYDQAFARSYLNGVFPPTGQSVVSKSNQTNPSINNYIGYAPSYASLTNAYLNGDLYYLAIYNDALGTADRNLAETNGPVTASNATIQYSTDGSNWVLSSPTAPGCSVLTRGLAWNGNYWVAVGRDATAANNIKYSYDGHSWLPSAAGAFNTEGSAVCWNGQAWFATGRDTTATANTIKYSFDGRNWSNITSGGFSNTAATGGIHITYDGTKLLATGFGTTATSNVKYSYDGLNWSDASGSFTTAGFALTYGADVNPRLRIDGLDFYNEDPNPFIRSTNTIYSQTPQLTTSLTHSTNMVLNNTVYINSPNGVGINIDGISSAAVALYVYGSTYTNNPNPVKLTGGSWTSVSDSNWKETLPVTSDQILLDAANYISSLKPKEFNYKKTIIQPYINTKGIEMRNMVVSTKNLANNRGTLSQQEELAVTTLKKIKGNDELTSYNGQFKEIAEEAQMMREIGFLSYDIGSTITQAIEPINIEGTVYEGVNYDQINMIHLATTHHLMSTIECQTSTLQGQEEEMAKIYSNFQKLGDAINLYPPFTITDSSANLIADPSGVRLTWSIASDPTNFSIFYKTATAPAYSEIALPITSLRQYDLSQGLIHATPYKVYMESYNQINRRSKTPVYDITFYQPPEQPTNISAEPVADNALQISWDAPTYAPQFYNVSWSAPAAPDAISGSVPNLAGSQTSYTATGLTPDVTYDVTVKAVSGVLESALTQVTGTPIRYPDPPTGVAVTYIDLGFTVSWTDSVDPSVTSYSVFYKLAGAGSYTEISNASSPTTISGLTDLATYQVYVTAVNGSGLKSSPNPATYTAYSFPIVDTVPSATPSNGQLTLGFTANLTGGTFLNFKIYDSDDNLIHDNIGASSIDNTGTGSASGTKAISGLVNGVSKTYKISVVTTEGGNTQESAKVSVTGTPFDYPVLSSSSVVEGDQELTFNLSATTYGGSVKEYRMYSGGSKTISDVPDMSSASPTFNIGSLENGSTYTRYFYVVATIGGIDYMSQTAVPLEGIPYGAPIAASAASASVSKISNADAGKITVASSSFNSNGRAITDYKIYLYDNTSALVSGYPITVSSLPYTLTGLIYDNYTIKVSAINARGEGGLSTETSSLSVWTAPTITVTSMVLSEGSGTTIPSVILTWTVNLNGTDSVVNYDLYANDASTAFVTGTTTNPYTASSTNHATTLGGNAYFYIVPKYRLASADTIYTPTKMESTTYRTANILIANLPSVTNKFLINNNGMVPYSFTLYKSSATVPIISNNGSSITSFIIDVYNRGTTANGAVTIGTTAKRTYTLTNFDYTSSSPYVINLEESDIKADTTFWNTTSYYNYYIYPVNSIGRSTANIASWVAPAETSQNGILFSASSGKNPTFSIFPVPNNSTEVNLQYGIQTGTIVTGVTINNIKIYYIDNNGDEILIINNTAGPFSNNGVFNVTQANMITYFTNNNISPQFGIRGTLYKFVAKITATYAPLSGTSLPNITKTLYTPLNYTYYNLPGLALGTGNTDLYSHVVSVSSFDGNPTSSRLGILKVVIFLTSTGLPANLNTINIGIQVAYNSGYTTTYHPYQQTADPTYGSQGELNALNNAVTNSNGYNGLIYPSLSSDYTVSGTPSIASPINITYYIKATINNITRIDLYISNNAGVHNRWITNDITVDGKTEYFLQ